MSAPSAAKELQRCWMEKDEDTHSVRADQRILQKLASTYGEGHRVVLIEEEEEEEEPPHAPSSSDSELCQAYRQMRRESVAMAQKHAYPFRLTEKAALVLMFDVPNMAAGPSALEHAAALRNRVHTLIVRHALAKPAAPLVLLVDHSQCCSAQYGLHSTGATNCPLNTRPAPEMTEEEQDEEEKEEEGEAGPSVPHGGCCTPMSSDALLSFLRLRSATADAPPPALAHLQLQMRSYCLWHQWPQWATGTRHTDAPPRSIPSWFATLLAYACSSSAQQWGLEYRGTGVPFIPHVAEERGPEPDRTSTSPTPTATAHHPQLPLTLFS